VVSFDGETWEIYNQDDPNKYNYNFVVATTVSSESGTLATEVKNGRAASGGRSMDAPVQKAPQRMKPDEQLLNQSSIGEMSARNQTTSNSSLPAAFPAVTRYRIYRSQTPYGSVTSPTTTYVDPNALMNYYYEVTAFYGVDESEKSNRASIITIVANELEWEVTLSPTRFFDYVELKGSEFVKRIEVFSVSGKRCLTLDDPNERIQTSSLAPGLYFFRIYGKDNLSKVIKAVKTK
jgi:hypothetical protein